jgi:hypothetical protein
MGTGHRADHADHRDIPRGQVVLAGGTAKPDDDHIGVEARRGDTRFGICSTTLL